MNNEEPRALVIGMIISKACWQSVWFGLLLLISQFATAGMPQTDEESPRVQALLEQAWMAESGRGLHRNPGLAASLYHQAGRLGSGEGYYRAALIYIPAGQSTVRNHLAACYLSAASQFGHERATSILENSARHLPNGLHCNDDITLPTPISDFKFDDYLSGLAASKKEIVALIRRHAPRYGVDTQLALAIASVESNFNSRAISPKSAMGVMQLIPATAARFGVINPFDPEQNIRGGLAYLRWLKQYYKNDVVRIISAYNAGEGAVDYYRGMPPFPETVAYVGRVLHFSGYGLAYIPATGAGRQ